MKLSRPLYQFRRSGVIAIALRSDQPECAKGWLGGALKNVTGFAEKDFPGHRQAHGFAVPIKQGEPDLVLEIVDLAADARLRHMKS